MELHWVASRVLTVVPRNPAELHDKLSGFAHVLAQEPRMLWSCVGLSACAAGLALSRRWPSTLLFSLATGVAAIVWLKVDHLHEGVILFRLSAEHGITEADLLVPLVGGVAGLCWLAGQIRHQRRRRRGIHRPGPPTRIKALIPAA